MAQLIGTAPNQVPTNADLGIIAFQDQNAVNITGGTITATQSAPDITGYQLVANSYPLTPPTLMLDFANSKALDPRITFARSTTATYYDGITTALAEQNLLLYSQAIGGTGWALNANATAVLNSAVAPDGTTTATTFTAVQQFSNVQSSVVLPAGTSTLSIYAYRSSGTNVISVYSNSGQNLGSYTPTSTWQRFTVTFTLAISETVIICQDRNTSGYTPVYIWGAQLEQRASATAYNATTTTALTNYIPVLQTAASGIARFDSNPVTGESLGLLIEESRTNLLTYSEQFDNAAWVKAAAVATSANSLVSPDGTITADTWTRSLAAAQYMQQYITKAASALAYTSSIYVKANVGDYFAMQIQGTYPARAWATFNVRTGVISVPANSATFASPSASILPVGNGWYRCTLTATTDTATSLGSYLSFNSNNIVIDGTDSVTNSSGFIWGAQLEAGAFATSYIPTVGSPLPRAADSASMTGTNFSSWYNQGQGTMYAAFSKIGVNAIGQQAVFAINNNSSTNRIDYREKAIGVSALYLVSSSGVDQSSIAIPQSVAGVDVKVSMAFSPNNFLISKNGASIVSTVSGAMPIAVTQLVFGQIDNSTNSIDNLNGRIKRIAYYPVALTATQLQALTS